MTTTPTATSTAPWDQPGHFQPNDPVTLIRLHDTGHTELACTVIAEGRVLVRGSAHQYPMTITPWPAHIRHDRDCRACGAYLAGARLLSAQGAAAFLAQWSPEAHARFEALTEAIEVGEDGQCWSFAAHADVPSWLRTATAGLLQLPEAGGLQLARVWDRIDWPALIDQHPGEVTVAIGPTGGYGPEEVTWDAVTEAFRMLDAAGLTPCLDVDLALDLDATLALEPSILYCSCPDTSLRARVSAVLGGIDYDDHHPGWSWC